MSEVHPVNAFFPIATTTCGIAIVCSEGHLQNALSPCLSRHPGLQLISLMKLFHGKSTSQVVCNACSVDYEEFSEMAENCHPITVVLIFGFRHAKCHCLLMTFAVKTRKDYDCRNDTKNI